MFERKPELIKIGETYIRFAFEYSDSNKARIKEAYLEQIGFTVKEHLKNSEFLKISIEYEEGSLKTRIIVWGTALYLGVANYGSFRAGVREIVNDVRHFSEYVIERIDDGPSINTNDILRTEKRTGLSGRLMELYSRIENFERNTNDMSDNEIQTELRNIKQEIANLIQLLSAQDEQAFLIDIGDNYTHNLPRPNDRRTTYLMNRYGLKPDDEIEFVNE